MKPLLVTNLIFWSYLLIVYFWFNHRFVYCEEIQVEEEHVIQTLIACQKYMYPQIAAALCDFKIRKIQTNSDVFEFYEQIQKYEFIELNNFLVATIQSSISNLIKDESFLNIQRSTLEFILKQSHLNVSEHDLFDACIRWTHAECVRNGIINPEPDQLRQTLGDLLYFIRILLFTPQIFADIPCKSGIFTKNEMLEILLHLNSNKDLMNDFVSKFNSNIRTSATKWLDILTYSFRDDKVSWRKISTMNHFYFDDVVYLKGFGIRKNSVHECNEGNIKSKELTIFIGSEIVLSKCFNVNHKDDRYEILFDFPIVVKCEKISIKFDAMCSHDTTYSICKTCNVQTRKNKSITCEYQLDPLPNCISGLSLLLC